MSGKSKQLPSKLFAFAACALLVSGLILIVCLVFNRYDYYRYENSVDIFLGEAAKNGCTSEVDGLNYSVESYNLQYAKSLLTVSEREQLRKKPDVDGLQRITAYVSEDFRFELYLIDEQSQDAYLCTVFNGTQRNFSIDGVYKVFERAVQYLGAAGVYSENPLLQ